MTPERGSQFSETHEAEAVRRDADEKARWLREELEAGRLEENITKAGLDENEAGLLQKFGNSDDMLAMPPEKRGEIIEIFDRLKNAA